MHHFFAALIAGSVRISACAALLTIVSVQQLARAQDQTKSRLTYLMEQADRITLELKPAGAEPVELERQPQPALKFTNPLNAGQADGALLFWLDGEMPIVAASLYIRKNNELFRELASLAESPLTGTCDGSVIWSPATGCFARQVLPGQTPPAENERLRLTQMKRAAERFSLKNTRLLPTPVYRYQSAKYGVIDGAVFGLVRATDPDMLVLIEAVEDAAGTKGWQYALGRMHSFAAKVQLDGNEVAAFDPYWENPDPKLPYVEQPAGRLPDELVRRAHSPE